MKLSVFTPTLDRPQFLFAACKSLLAQSGTDWEWVVYDVGEINVKLPDDPRIKYHQGERKGPAADFQAALELTTGDVVTPMADDDKLPPYALETALAELGDREWLIGRTVIVSEDGYAVALRGGTIEDVEDTMHGSYMLGGAVYWRREFGDKLGGFNSEFDGAADFDLYRRMIAAAPPALTREVLYLYNAHSGTDSVVNADRQADASQRVAVAKAG